MRLLLALVAVGWLGWESWFRPLSWSFFLALALSFLAVLHLFRLPGRE